MLLVAILLIALVTEAPGLAAQPALTSLSAATTSTPTPCPSASPSVRSLAVLPAPCPSPTLAVIGKTGVVGRKANLVGKADAASEGSINQEEIATRPILRPGEVLEAIPGLVISQHSGEGKANQYYLRGFQLDHGTDLESTINGMPINLPTHAHGQGYSDINWLIPELVGYVEFKKGPYYADQGDFSTAGSYNLYYRNTIAPVVSYSLGQYGYDRFFLAASPKAGSGNLLYALEVVHDNGSFVKPDEYQRLNGVLRWSRASGTSDFNITLMAQQGLFDSTDQIPERLVAAGLLSRFGYVDPSDGGSTYRYSLSTQWQHQDDRGVTKISAYGYQSYLDLFSNFEFSLNDATDYYNVTQNPITCSAQYSTCAPGPQHVSTYTSYCPANAAPPGPGGVPQPFSFSCGDQREQQDIRFVSGFNVSRSFITPATETTIGAGVRNDNIAEVGLFLTNARVRYANGTLSDDHVVERDSNLWAESRIQAGPKLRLIPGIRGDVYNFDVYDPNPANSGKTAEGMVNPKFTAAYAMSEHHELYADFGDSFHSNDARGIFQRLDPQTHATYDATGSPVQPVTPLVRAVGEELGYRLSVPKYTGTLSLWRLNLNSELVFDGDHGTTSAGGPTVRRGIELADFWTPTPWLTYDADFSNSSARFLTNFNGQGTSVPESLNAVVAAGATIDLPRYSASLRLRYFGPRVLDQEGDAHSTGSLVFNGQVTAKLRGGFRLTLEGLNLLNAQTDDIEYYYATWLKQDAANPAFANNPTVNPALGGSGINDYVFHPAEAQTFRLTLSKSF